MTIPPLLADRDLEFADWGTPVVLQRVTQSYSAESAAIVETIESFDVVAIVGSSASEGVPQAGGQLRSVELAVRIKAEAFPASTAAVTWRLVYQGETFDVVDQSLSACGLVRELVCRKVG